MSDALVTQAKKLLPYVKKVATEGAKLYKSLDKVVDVVTSFPVSTVLPDKYEKVIKKSLSYVRDAVWVTKETTKLLQKLCKGSR